MLDRHCLYVGIFQLIILAGVANGEFYSSVDSMQDLAQVEEELLNATRSYVESQQKQLDFYRRYVEQIRQEHEWATSQLKLDDYLGHPLHAFRLIKRLVQDWDALIFEPILANNAREEFRAFVEVLSRDLGYPDQSELQGAIKGLARLQKVYNLATSDLADGIIGGFTYGSDLQWRECYEIGVQLFDLGEYQRSLEWLQVAFILLQNSPREEKDEDHYFSDIQGTRMQGSTTSREYPGEVEHPMANSELGLIPKIKRERPTASRSFESQPNTLSPSKTQKYLESTRAPKECQGDEPLLVFQLY
ncbi:GM12884 [Drosophila sechellia]|uniref:GM12884 n=1 Tax=Drosophila sechellia TaxID=7238 RepID=B4HZR6_DROSE|nr:GM12884 [Drosophila sechellia]